MSLDISLVTELAPEYLANWADGKDIAWGRGKGFEMCFGEGPKRMALTYTQFDQAAFDDFIEKLNAVELSPFHTAMVNYFSVGVSRFGYVLSAEIIQF